MYLKHIFLLLLLSVHSLIIPAFGDNSMDELISRHIEWRGGVKALENLEAVSQSGTISVAGMQGSITLAQYRDGHLYQSFDLGVFKGTDVVTPDDSWVINSSGQIEDLGISSQQDHTRTLQNTFTNVILGKSSLDRKMMPPEKRDGMQYGVIRFTYENGDYFDMFIDPESGAHDWTRNVTDGKTIWHKISDWRMVGNLRFPFHEQTLHAHEAENSETSWERIAFNDELDPTLFVRPEQPMDNAGIKHGSATRWLPIQTYLDRYIFMRGHINGHETDIILDSGAGITVLDKRFAENAGIQGEGALQAHGVSGSMTASMTDGISIEIDSLHLTNLTAAILDLSEVSRGLGKDIPVILGKEIFNNFIVDIDYTGKRIAFREYGDYTYSGPGKPLRLYPGDDGHKLLDIVIENHPPARVTLDTGSGQTVTLFSHYWDDAHKLLDDGRIVSDNLSGGVGGESASTISSLKSVSIAGFTLNNVPAEFYTSTAGSFNTKRLAGNLGSGILNRFRVIFDYSRDRLILEPSAGFTDKPFKRNRVGLQLRMTQQELRIVHVAKGSPAEKAGWKKGDILHAANSERMNDRYRERWQELSTATVGTSLELTNGKGITTTIILADYY
ncbi:MAG TPA: hypothetical protein DDW55_12640 [Gammaproteobacteria bacterium]|nr:hypothetical protein [Gammaproteobacteria bacterium]